MHSLRRQRGIPERGETTVITGGWRGPGWQITGADPGHARQIRDRQPPGCSRMRASTARQAAGC
jgi:hypothetical protein